MNMNMTPVVNVQSKLSSNIKTIRINDDPFRSQHFVYGDDDGDGIKSISKYDLAFDNNGMIIDQSSSNISSSINENCLFQMSSQSTQPPPPPTLEIQRQMIFKSEKFQRKLSEPLSIEKTNPSTSGSGGQYWLWARPSTPIMKNVNKIVMNECRL